MSMKLGKMINETLNRWERESVLNMAVGYGTWKSHKLVTWANGSKNFEVILKCGTELTCSFAGYQALRAGYNKTLDRISL